MITKLQDPIVRLYIYNIAKALIPCFVVFGLITENEISVIIGVVAAVLGFAVPELASNNVDTSEKDDLDDITPIEDIEDLPKNEG